MRAAAYVRVSTEDQAREGFSLAAQERACRTRAESEGWEWTECFRDEGISGATLDRPGLMAAIDADVDILIVKAQDRLSRDTIGYLTILQDAKAKLLSLDEGWLATDEDGEFVGTIFAARSQWERKRIARRIRDGLAEKARQGFHVGPVPLGYTRTDARLQPTPDAPHIVALFERYAGGGISLKDLASWARLHGLPGQDRLSVRKLLQNATYAGRVVYHNRGPDRAEYDGQHAPIVSLQLFDRVQAQLRYRRRGSSTVHWGRQTYPLTGIAHCAAGGHPLSGARSSNHNARYMRCRATLTKGRTACPQRMVPADELESQIGAYFDGFTLPKGEVAAVMDLLAPEAPARDPETTRRLRLWQRLHEAGEIDEEEYERQSERLRDDPIVQPPVVDLVAAAELLTDVHQLWNETDAQGRRALATTLFRSVTVDRRLVTALEPSPVYAELFKIDREYRFYGDLGAVWLPGQDSNLRPSG